MSLVVVTGASGFVGRRLVDSLAADGVRVRGITRRAGAMPQNVEEAVAADVLDRDAIRAALAGASSVVHLAARVHARPEGKGDPASECRRINVDGTAVVLEEAAAAGVRTFVLASSVKAVATESDEMLTPDTPPQPGDSYGESKLEAERLVRVVAAREGIRAPILRLPVVYGPGMKANMAALFAAVDRGLPLPLASVKNRRSFAYVGNVVNGIRALLDSERAQTDPYYVSDGEDLSTPALVRRIAAALGKPPRLVGMPVSLLRAAGSTGGLLSRIAGLHFSTDSVTAVVGSLFVDNSSLRAMTGYKPTFSVDTGMALTAEWYRSRKLRRR
jgi:nucleoside-diphosphate-sugar epimerase